jgi:prepilin-type N-terminal cleavage/methylation domain-containing protein
VRSGRSKVPAARARPGEAGFTLIELMVTLIVSLIGMAAMLQLHTSMARANQSSERQLEASSLCEAVLEELRGLSRIELAAALDKPTEWPIVEADLGNVTGRAGIIYRRRMTIETVEPAPSALMRLRMEVRWSDDGSIDGPDDHTTVIELLRPEQGSL